MDPAPPPDPSGQPRRGRIRAQIRQYLDAHPDATVQTLAAALGTPAWRVRRSVHQAGWVVPDADSSIRPSQPPSVSQDPVAAGPESSPQPAADIEAPKPSMAPVAPTTEPLSGASPPPQTPPQATPAATSVPPEVLAAVQASIENRIDQLSDALKRVPDEAVEKVREALKDLPQDVVEPILSLLKDVGAKLPGGKLNSANALIDLLTAKQVAAIVDTSRAIQNTALRIGQLAYRTYMTSPWAEEFSEEKGGVEAWMKAIIGFFAANRDRVVDLEMEVVRLREEARRATEMVQPYARRQRVRDQFLAAVMSLQLAGSPLTQSAMESLLDVLWRTEFGGLPPPPRALPYLPASAVGE